MFKGNFYGMSAIATACLVLVACGGGSDNDSSGGSGTLSVSITDAPIHDAQSVTVNFVGAEVKPEEGPAMSFYFCKDPVNPDVDPPVIQETDCTDSEPHVESIDLLQQTGGASALLLDGVEVPAGRINWIRLILADDVGEIVLSTGSFPLSVPSGSQNGLKLNRGFDVPEDNEAHIYIDFDVRKSIVERHNTTPPNYRLKPVLRLVDDFGAVRGEVAASLMTMDCLGGSIYVFDGADATLDDIDRDDGDPVTSTMVKADAGSATGFSYFAGFLEPGEYTMAFVCAGGISMDNGMTFDEPADDPDEDDVLSFTPVAGQNVTILDGQTVTSDF